MDGAGTTGIVSFTWRMSMSSSYLSARSCFKLSLLMLLIEARVSEQRVLHASWLACHPYIVLVRISVWGAREFFLVDVRIPSKIRTRSSMWSCFGPVVVNSIVCLESDFRNMSRCTQWSQHPQPLEGTPQLAGRGGSL